MLNINNIILVFKCLHKVYFTYTIRKVLILLKILRTRVIDILNLNNININR